MMALGAEDLVWIGLAHVSAALGCEIFDPKKSAFANVVGRASTRAAFERLLREACAALNLTVDSVEDVEPYAERFAEAIPPADIDAAMAEARGVERIGFGMFYTYSVD